jgi:hypothetical protein
MEMIPAVRDSNESFIFPSNKFRNDVVKDRISIFIYARRFSSSGRDVSVTLMAGMAESNRSALSPLARSFPCPNSRQLHSASRATDNHNTISIMFTTYLWQNFNNRHENSVRFISLPFHLLLRAPLGSPPTTLLTAPFSPPASHLGFIKVLPFSVIAEHY